MRMVSLLLWVLFGWPISLIQIARAKKRLHQRRSELGLTVERVA
jgi:hypothetical protein